MCSCDDRFETLLSRKKLSYLKSECLLTIFSKRKCIAIYALQSLIGSASVHRVRYSIIVIIYLALDLFFCALIGLMKFTAHLSNACNVTYGNKVISSLLDVKIRITQNPTAALMRNLLSVNYF